MTLTLIDRVHPDNRSAILSRMGAKALALAGAIRRRRSMKEELAMLSPRDLQDIGLRPSVVASTGSRRSAQDAATELYCSTFLKRRSR